MGQSIREWLVGLTRPEDDILWVWIAVVAGYAAIGAVMGLRARRHAAHKAEAPAPSTDPSKPSVDPKNSR